MEPELEFWRGSGLELPFSEVLEGVHRVLLDYKPVLRAVFLDACLRYAEEAAARRKAMKPPTPKKAPERAVSPVARPPRASVRGRSTRLANHPRRSRGVDATGRETAAPPRARGTCRGPQNPSQEKACSFEGSQA